MPPRVAPARAREAPSITPGKGSGGSAPGRPGDVRRIALICGLISALLGAAPASADHGETITDPVIVESIQLAADHFGKKRECAHAVWLGRPTTPRPWSTGDPHCQIYLNETDTDHPAMWCRIFVHEYGHMLGYTHESSIWVMWNPWSPGSVPSCLRFGFEGHTYWSIRPLARARTRERVGTGFSRKERGRLVANKAIRGRVRPVGAVDR